MHYKVVSDDELDYCWIPSTHAVVEGYLRTKEQQDYREWIENIVVDQPRNWTKVYKETTGFDIEKFNKSVAHNGYDYWLESLEKRKENNGKIYGKTIPKE